MIELGHFNFSSFINYTRKYLKCIFQACLKLQMRTGEFKQVVTSIPLLETAPANAPTCESRIVFDTFMSHRKRLPSPIR